MQKMIFILLFLVGIVFGDTYTLKLDTDGGQGNLTFPTATKLKYQHDGSVVPTTVPWVLDSVQIHAVDAANNVGPKVWIYIKITPVNDHAPVVKSDTVTVIEGGSVTWTPTVTDDDN